MPDGLYERDFLVWSEQQSDLLRRIADGERLNAAVDWPNLIEEVRDLGLSELHACESLIRNALVHLLKVAALPNSDAVRHWKSETVGFLSGAQSRFTPSMRQRIDVDRLFRQALAQTRLLLSDDDPWQPPATLPLTLDQLLDEAAGIDALVGAFMQDPKTPASTPTPARHG